MPRYTKEVKEKAVKMALEGTHLKTVQTEVGPNPKATERYIVKANKAGTCKFKTYKEVLADLKTRNIVPQTLRQESIQKKETKKGAKVAPVSPITERLE